MNIDPRLDAALNDFGDAFEKWMGSHECSVEDFMMGIAWLKVALVLARMESEAEKQEAA